MTDGDRALIFDMDGVLIDSEPLWRRAEIKTFGEVGLVLDDADCFQTTGLRIDEAVAYWYKRTPWTSPSQAEIASTIVTRMSELIRIEGEPMPGVMTSIDRATQSRWRLGLASSSSRLLIDSVLDRFGIANLFECVCSAEDETFGKPDPAVYLSTADALGLDPGACVAVEDSANGVDSAIAAGMHCIAVPPPETRDDPRFARATLVLRSLEDLPDALTRFDEIQPRTV
jgi:HAD superfamily hydrolase (TIGR01509 family)